MARTKRSNGHLPPFVPTLKEMIKSPAYQSLSNSARVAYLLLCSQRNPWSQPEVIFPYRDAEPYMRSQAWKAAISQLVESGFIQVRQQGGLYRVTNIYQFTDEWKNH